MIALANRVNGERDDGECWPALRTIARDAGMSKSAVDRSVKHITVTYPDELEVIEEGGPRKAARYRLPFAERPTEGHKGYPQRPSEGRSVPRKGTQRPSQGGTEPEVTGMNLRGAAQKSKPTCDLCPAHAVAGTTRCHLHTLRSVS